MKDTGMTKKFYYGMLFSLFLIFGVFIAGCSDQAPDTTPVPTTPAYQAKYVAGGHHWKNGSLQRKTWHMS